MSSIIFGNTILGLFDHCHITLTHARHLCCVCVFQVAGRLHVEVWRGTEGSAEEGDSEPSGAQQNAADGEAQERKLECVVRTTQPRS